MTAMNCPVCNAPFRESLHDGILIDICTQCRGVWLDRGELEKLLSAVKKNVDSSEPDASRRDAPPAERHRDARYEEKSYRKRDYDDDDDDDYRRQYNGRHTYHTSDQDRYRKRSKLEALFGMFD